MAQHVDKVNITVGPIAGVEINVQQFELSVAINAIPSITLEILPVRSTPGVTEASSPTFSEITSMYNTLFEASLDCTTTTSVSIEIEPSEANGGCSKQNVTLKEWILTDVGLSSVTTYSAPTLVIILQHPIVRLSRTGEIYEIPILSHLSKFYQSVGGKTMVALMDDVINKMATEQNIIYYKIGPAVQGGSTKFEGKVKAFRTAMADDLPGKYLNPKGNIFLENVAQDLRPILIEAIARLMSPFFGGVSTWYKIINDVCPKCLMQVRPTYAEKKLSLEPLQPWSQDNLHVIDESLIESIDIPAKDPTPLCGVAVERDMTSFTPTYDQQTKDAVHYTNADIEDQKCCKHAFFIADKANPPELRYGRIDALGPSWVISTMLAIDSPGVVAEATNDLQTVEQKIKPEKKVIMEDTYAKAMFEALYRRNCRSSITTSLMFRDAGGGLIYPGDTLKISAGGKDLFLGYLTRMVITGSTTSGCSSKFEMNYSRDCNDKRLLVDEFQKNGCYSS